MTRRFRQQPDGTLIEVSGDAPARSLPVDSGALWGDAHYDGQRATDGTPIDTRTKHREYMRANGLTTIDDFTQHFQRTGQERERHYRGEDASRREDVARALARLHG